MLELKCEKFESGKSLPNGRRMGWAIRVSIPTPWKPTTMEVHDTLYGGGYTDTLPIPTWIARRKLVHAGERSVNYWNVGTQVWEIWANHFLGRFLSGGLILGRLFRCTQPGERSWWAILVLVLVVSFYPLYNSFTLVLFSIHPIKVLNPFVEESPWLFPFVSSQDGSLYPSLRPYPRYNWITLHLVVLILE